MCKPIIVFCGLFILIISTFILNAQTQKDVDILFGEASALMEERKYDEAIEQYLKVIETERSATSPDLQIISQSLNNIGTCYYLQNNYKDAITWFEKALEEDRKLGIIENIATRYNNIGLAYKKLGTYDFASVYYKKAWLLDEEQGDTLGLAKSLNNLGSLYDTWGRYDTAILYYEKSLRLKETMGDSAGVAVTLNNIGLVYKLWGKYDQALAYFERALAIDQLLGKDNEMAKRLNNIGLVYHFMEQFHKALGYFNQALEIARKNNNNDLIAITYNNMGSSYLKLKQTGEAIRYLNLALDIFRDIGSKTNVAAVLGNLSDIYVAEGNYNLALNYLSQSTEITEKNQMRDQTKASYLSYTEIYMAMGNYSEALKYYKKYTNLKDTLYSEEIHRQITDFEIKYETEKKDKEIKLLKQKEEIQNLEIKKEKIFRNSLIASIVLLLSLAVVIYLSLNQKKRDNRIIAVEKAKSDDLLLNILPAGIASDLKEKGSTEPRLYEHVTVCFTDIVGFTEKSSTLEPKFLIEELNDIFTAFDNIVQKQQCERIKTIGDSYLAVCGLPEKNPDHAVNIIRSAIEMIQYIEKKNIESGMEWHIRAGIHSGDVIAGVVGVKKYIYDVFGDTINTASRMECTSEPMKINVSESTYELVKDIFRFEERGEIEVKGKGWMKMYFIKS